MTMPRKQDVMLPLLKLLGDGAEHVLSKELPILAKEFNLSEEEQSRMIPSGQMTVFKSRAGWARTYLKKAGLAYYPRRGILQITERGLQVLRSGPSAITIDFLKQFDEFNEFLSRRPDGQQESDARSESVEMSETPEELLEAAYARLRADLEDELLSQIKTSSAQFFEQLVVDLLVAMGYGGNRRDAGQAVGKAGDGGVDGIIKEDRLGLDRIYVQAKRWENTVGRPEIQKFAGALQGHQARKGVVITTASFSREARAYADAIESNIVLIDGSMLVQLMVDHNLGVSPTVTYELKRIDTDYFSDE